jgi:hypothetical protein
MLAVGSAVVALVCFLLALLLGLSGAEIGFDLVTLGFVFVALWMLVRSLPPRRVP